MSALTEQYRPKTWADVVGQDKLVARIQALAKRGLTGRAFWLSGQSGTGKTTIARLLAAEVANEFMVREIDAGTLTVSALAELERESQVSGLFGDKQGRAYIVNEAHGLRKDVIRQLLVALERIPAHVVWVFTTTVDGQENLFEDSIDASPLLSRCIFLPLARRDLAKAFAERAKSIAEKEGLDGRDLKQYLRLVNDHRSNLRAVLQAIEAGEMAI
jgi:DNA polymerase-3 subunit gamma/tau